MRVSTPYDFKVLGHLWPASSMHSNTPEKRRATNAGPHIGAIDEASAHYRRYTPKELKEKVVKIGWVPLESRYMNVAGVLPY